MAAQLVTPQRRPIRRLRTGKRATSNSESKFDVRRVDVRPTTFSHFLGRTIWCRICDMKLSSVVQLAQSNVQFDAQRANSEFRVGRSVFDVSLP